MPTNVTAEYKAAEARYREAREPSERLDALREMLRTLPKHKGTEHLQADIRSRISELTEEASRKKGGARSGPPTVIRPEGAAQVAFLGPPNAGKSALHAALTGSRADPEPYPYATQYPVPGMIPVDDIHIQAVDLPSVSSDHDVPWIGNALQPADAALLIVDLNQAGCVEAVADLVSILGDRRVRLTGRWPADPGGAEEDDDPFATVLPTVLVAAKADLVADVDTELETFAELAGLDLPTLVTSAEEGTGLEAVGRFCFERLGIVRVYTRAPGRRQPDDGRPYTIRQGGTVADVAELVHREIADSLAFARLWGGGDFDGQQVGRDHVLCDGDVIELHT